MEVERVVEQLIRELDAWAAATADATADASGTLRTIERAAARAGWSCVASWEEDGEHVLLTFSPGG